MTSRHAPELDRFAFPFLGWENLEADAEPKGSLATNTFARGLAQEIAQSTVSNYRELQAK
jgi:hypothetical protein